MLLLTPDSLLDPHGVLRPFVCEALDAIGQMRGETGARLAFALVVRSSNDAAAVLSTLRELRLPAGPSQVIETNKPGVDATILRELQERFAVNDPASECVLIDAGPGSTDAALPPGLPKLLLEETGADGMSGWPAMLLKIARKTGRNAAENLQLVLPVLAAAEGVVDLQQVSFRPKRIEAEGHCLISVEDSALGALSGLFLNLPTSFVIEQPDSPPPVAFKEVAEDTIQEAKAYIQSLRANGQLEMAPGETGQAEAGELEGMASPLLGQPTHYVETDETGRRILRRRGFN